jgi:hypothetical protein
MHTLRWLYGKTWRIPDKLRMNLSYKLVNSPVGVLKLVASEKGLVAVPSWPSIHGVSGQDSAVANLSLFSVSI